MPNTNIMPQAGGGASGMPLGVNGQKLMLSTARMQGHAMRAVLNTQIETLGFLKHRYEQDLKLVDMLTDSAGFNDAFSTCSEFWKEAMSEYSDEAGKIVSISSKMAAEAAKNLRSDAERISAELTEKSVA